MLALPGSLVWLFFLVYFVPGHNLDITSLSNNQSNIIQKDLDEFSKAINLTSHQSHEEEKKNKTSELPEVGENRKSNFQDKKQWDLSENNSSASNVQFLTGDLQELNKTALVEPSGRSGRSRIANRTSSVFNSTKIPTMSQERRNSYLSIAERRKYYNRTREIQTKKTILNNFEMDYQGVVNKLITSSTETLQINEIREVKKPITKEFSTEVTTETIQTNNQKTFVNFSSNETQGKTQTVRQSVIQSQYQFGQKLNLRKPVLRGQDIQEERFRRKKEKIKDSTSENNTNKLNKNYPTQSTKLLKVDKNLWATTTIPQADGEKENFNMYSPGNETVPKKLTDYVTSNHTQVSGPNILRPLPLNNRNINIERRNLSKNIGGEEEKILIQDIYSQEILKLNNSISKKALASDKLGEISVVNFSNYHKKVNDSETDSVEETTLDASKVQSTVKTTNILRINVNTTYGSNFNSFTTPSHVRNENFSNYEVTQPTFSKSDFKEETHEIYRTTTPLVKAIHKESLNLTTKLKSNQSETNVLSGFRSHVSQKNETSETKGSESKNKMEEYPLTIELNENNKRVLSEMFQTVTTSKPKQITKEEISTSQPKLQDILSITPSVKNSATNSSATTFTTKPVSNTKTVSSTESIITTTSTTDASSVITSTVTVTEHPEVLPSDDHQEDHKAQGTRYGTKFYISPKFSGTQVIKVIEDDDDDDDEVDDVDKQSHSAGAAIYVLGAFGLIPLLLALVFGTKFITQRNQREYECESDAKSDISANESELKEGKKKKGSTDLKKSPSNVTTITLVTPTRLPRVQHWENSEKQGNRNWEFPRSKLKLTTILGQGNFGQVWKAEAEDMPGHEGVTRLVAVKTVKEGATEKEHTEFIKELEIMQQIGSHPNIVTLLGCCTDQEPYYLIMEYVKYGKLLTYLREHRINENYYNFSSDSNALTSKDLTVFAYCVARGMEYLVSRGIIHRDLAARNVLVDHNKLCKIADFGMSRSVRDFENGQVYEERQQKGALPIRWMAPESLVYSVFTCKSDVWSFGIVMWEIVTLGSTPYPNMGAREVMRKVTNGYRLERPSHCKPEFYRLISHCWAHDPHKRPDFSELRHELSNLLDNPTKDGSYVDLDRFAVDNSFHVSSKTNDFRLLERNDFKTLQKLGDWNKKDWSEDIRKIKLKKGRNDGKGTVTLTGQGSFTVNSRILEKEFKIT